MNLSLWIVGKNEDGYHNLITIFYKIPIYDEIWVEEWDEPMIICEGIKSTSGNTVYKALKFLSDYVGRNVCLKIKIKKRIPVGGGLGGGSSDAATVLKAANRIFKLNLGEEDLVKIGSKVGADVPFFIIPQRAAIGRGIGNILEPVDLDIRSDWVLVFPSFPVPTKLAYDLFDSLGKFTDPSYAERKAEEIVKEFKRGNIPSLENDFEKVIHKRYPEIGKIKDILTRNGWNALMSGSGSSVFGIGEGDLDKLDWPYKVWYWSE